MFPVIADVFGFPIHTYGLMLGLSFIAGLYTAIVLGRASGIKSDDIGDLALLSLITGLIGARILFVAVEWDQFQDDPGSIVLRRDGFVFYGGLLLAVPSALYFIRRRGLDTRTTADVMAPALVLAHSIGRIGCFAQGCCFGAPSDYGLLFHPDSPPSLAFGETPVHPTQLYEALLLLGLFGWLVHRFRARKFPGELILHYGISYAVIRFLLEFLRADDRGFYAGSLSVSQIISIAVLGVALSVYAFWRRPSPVSPG